MRIHVVAVSGTGMGPLAGLLSAMGHEVTGSDVAFDPPIGPRLREWGIRCMQGFSAENLAHRPDLVVVGNLCRPDNPEARAAIDSGMSYTHIGGALTKLVLPGARPLVVTGTHGKTTTSALAAGLLARVGLEPGYLIGGVPHGLSTSFHPPARRRHLLRAPAPAPFVLEGDEYDTAFFEKTAKFLHYGAEVVVLTSIEHDHIDIYPSIDDYRRPFRELLSGLPAAGHVIACASDPEVVAAVREAASVPVTWYALEGEDRHGEPAQWVAAPSTSGESGTSFDLFVGGVAAGRWSTPLMGRHNLANALGAMAACVHGFGVSPPDLRAPLAALAGVRRRQELLGSPDGVLVYDDFAHHPSAVRETLLAFRSRHPRARLFAVFEPRSATACGRLHQDVYPESFAVADELLLAPVARALPAEERLDVARVVRDVSQRGVEAACHEDADAIVRSLVERTRPGDVVAILSNGTFGQVHQKLLAALHRRAQLSDSGG